MSSLLNSFYPSPLSSSSCPLPFFPFPLPTHPPFSPTPHQPLTHTTPPHHLHHTSTTQAKTPPHPRKTQISNPHPPPLPYNPLITSPPPQPASILIYIYNKIESKSPKKLQNSKMRKEKHRDGWLEKLLSKLGSILFWRSGRRREGWFGFGERVGHM